MPHREFDRQSAVSRFMNQKFSRDHELQQIVETAAKICNTSTALITLIDVDTQHVIFKNGFKFDKTKRIEAFCNYVVETNACIHVTDALLDARFALDPLVTGDPHIRFYAGAPLKTPDGYTIGSLCVLDEVPRLLSEHQSETLSILANQVVYLMNLDASMRIVKDLYTEVKKSEIELRSFFESSIDHHLLLGKNFEVLAFNKSWEMHVHNAYGIQMERGKNMIGYVNQDHLRDFYKDYTTALSGTAVFDERNLKQGTIDSWRLVKFEPAFNTQGEIIGVSVNVSDVNKRVQQEETVKLQNKQLYEIAMMQSHEMRRPVASILGLMELIKANDYTADKQELLMLEQAVKELDSKIRDVVNATNT
jgi:PAS domain S-box-containing protein